MQLSAILLYMFSGWTSLDYVSVFVMTVLLLAFDFWTIKNISGRLLVGLRWGTRMTEDGKTEWYFMTHPERAGNAKPVDSRVFWMSVFSAPVVWALFAVSALLSFSLDWLILCSFALVLTGTNTYGYYKCSAAARQRIQEALTSTALQAAVGAGGGGGSIGAALFTSMFGAAATAAPGGPGTASGTAVSGLTGSTGSATAVAPNARVGPQASRFVGDASGLAEEGSFVHSSEGGIDGGAAMNPFDADSTV